MDARAQKIYHQPIPEISGTKHLDAEKAKIKRIEEHFEMFANYLKRRKHSLKMFALNKHYFELSNFNKKSDNFKEGIKKEFIDFKKKLILMGEEAIEKEEDAILLFVETLPYNDFYKKNQEGARKYAYYNDLKTDFFQML